MQEKCMISPKVPQFLLRGKFHIVEKLTKDPSDIGARCSAGVGKFSKFYHVRIRRVSLIFLTFNTPTGEICLRHLTEHTMV